MIHCSLHDGTRRQYSSALAKKLGAAAAAISANLSDGFGIVTSDALVHRGDASALRSVLQRHCLGQPAATLQVAALGGSMTYGSMNCHTLGKVLCNGAMQPRHCQKRARLVRACAS